MLMWNTQSKGKALFDNIYKHVIEHNVLTVQLMLFKHIQLQTLTNDEQLLKAGSSKFSDVACIYK